MVDKKLLDLYTSNPYHIVPNQIVDNLFSQLKNTKLDDEQMELIDNIEMLYNRLYYQHNDLDEEIMELRREYHNNVKRYNKLI